METSAVLQPQGGWYSSHWSIAPASLLSRPFTLSSSPKVNQALAGLQDLYRRAVFLLGLTSGLPVEKHAAAPGVNPPPEAARGTPGKSNEVANHPVPPRSRSLQSRKNPQPQPSPAAGPVGPRRASDPKAFPPQIEPDSEPRPAPENVEAAAAKAEVLMKAVHRLGAALETHEFLAQGLRQHGAELIGRFAQTLVPYGLSSADGSLNLDRQRWAEAYQENPQQVDEAFWGPNSLTPEIVSLAAAIVGAPGMDLLDLGLHSPETYQPFQSPNPWFRVAPTGFYQVA
jgi:hypothetical protein